MSYKRFCAWVGVLGSAVAGPAAVIYTAEGGHVPLGIALIGLICMTAAHHDYTKLDT